MFEGGSSGGGVIQCSASEAVLVAILAARMKMSKILKDKGIGMFLNCL